MSVNKVILLGNVCADPEVKYTSQDPHSNNKVATCRLATSERYKDRNGETKENTEFHSLVAWNSAANVFENYVKKGNKLYVEGHLRTREFTDQSGVKKHVTEVMVDRTELLGSRNDQQGQPARAQAPQAPQTPRVPTYELAARMQSQPAAPIDLGVPDEEESDLPF